ncbi:MAG: hypothetical protein K0U41_03890 [Gammaproteobacteria bacterium]|nr:hypothetical protein [Gammaproteobacteria bacterium]
MTEIHEKMSKAELMGIITTQSEELAQLKELTPQVQSIQETAGEHIRFCQNISAEAQTVKDGFNTHQEEYTKLNQEIKDFWEGDEDDEEDIGMKSEITTFWDGDEDDNEGIKNTIKTTLDNFENIWEGATKDSEGIRSGGKKDEVDKYIAKINSYWRTQKDENGKVIREGTKDYIERKRIEIDNLLFGATSVVLGKGYQEQLELHGKNAENYAKKFSAFLKLSILTLSAILIILLIFVFVSSDIIDKIKNLYWIIGPLFIAVSGLIIWLGTFLKDKEREERVLKSEYEHKRQFMHVFVGYIKDIKDLKVEHIVDTKSALTQLYETMINTAGRNPSLRISTKGSEHPAQSLPGKMKPEKGQKNSAGKGADAAT